MSENECTALLEKWRSGDRAAGDELMERLYDEMRRIAHYATLDERGDHTLQATALVNEAYMRLIGSGPGKSEDRARFLGLASYVIRQVLVDHARQRNAKKRGGGRVRVTLADDAAEAVSGRPPDVLDLEAALERLAELDPICAQVVVRRFYAGMSMAEVADSLEIGTTSVHRKWEFAKAWLFRELGTKK